MSNVFKKDFKKYLNIKVHHNKKNGQLSVMLPKRKMSGEIPKKISVSWYT